MTAVISLLLLFVVLVSLLYPHRLGTIASLLLMLPVIGYTLWFYISWHWPSPLFLGLYLLGGFTLGISLLIAGLPISSEQPGQYIKKGFTGLKQLFLTPGFAKIEAFIPQIAITLYEEIIWRVFLLTALNLSLPAWASVIISASLFWRAHPQNRELGLHSVEFWLFSIILSVIYLRTQSLFFVWAVHAGRNLLILGHHWNQIDRR